MITRPDIVVFSPDDKIQLIVEVKSKQQTSDAWAAQLRRNLITHAILPRAPYFLLATPDFLRLWRDTQDVDERQADVKVQTTAVLRPYLSHWGNAFPDEQSFELLIKTWLSNLVHSHLEKHEAPSELGWVFDTGLYDSIRHGHVERQTSA